MTPAGPNEATPNNLCVPNRKNIAYIDAAGGSVVGIANGEAGCDTATLSVNFETGNITFQQPNVKGEVFSVSCIASGFGDNDGCSV